MSHYFIEYAIEKIGSLCRNSIGTLTEIAFQWVWVGRGWCPHGSWCPWSTKNTTYMAFGYCASLFPSQNKKVKHIFVNFLSHNSDFYIGISSLHLAIQTLEFIRIVRYCKFTIARRKSEFWDKVTITLYPLYSMLEIHFHRFHMYKGEKKTHIQMHSPSNTHSHSFLLPLLPFSDSTILLPPTTITLLHPGIIFYLSDSLCCSASTKPIQISIFFYSMLWM